MKKISSTLLILLSIIMLCSCTSNGNGGNKNSADFPSAEPLTLGNNYVFEGKAEVSVEKIITTCNVDTLKFDTAAIDVVLNYKNTSNESVSFGSFAINDDPDKFAVTGKTPNGEKTYEAQCYSVEKGLNSSSVTSSATIEAGQTKKLHFVIEIDEGITDKINLTMGCGKQKYEYNNYPIYTTVLNPNIKVTAINPGDSFEVAEYGTFWFDGTYVDKEIRAPWGKLSFSPSSGEKFIVSRINYKCNRSDVINSDTVVSVTATSDGGKRSYTSEFYVDPSDDISLYSLTTNIQMSNGSEAQMYIGTEVPNFLKGPVEFRYEIGGQIFTYTTTIE